jgi:hypothetical protein
MRYYTPDLQQSQKGREMRGYTSDPFRNDAASSAQNGSEKMPSPLSPSEWLGNDAVSLGTAPKSSCLLPSERLGNDDVASPQNGSQMMLLPPSPSGRLPKMVSGMILFVRGGSEMGRVK